VLALLVAVGLALMTVPLIYAAVFSLPLVPFVLQLRVGVLLVSFLVPMLAGLGLVSLPQLLAALVLPRRVVPAAALAGLLLCITAVGAFAHYVGDSQYRLAYGGFQPDQRDLFGRHRDDPCVASTSTLCDSRLLTLNFNVTELVQACVDTNGRLRDVPICSALGDPTKPSWSATDDPLVASTLSWCAQAPGRDAVCDARYTPFGDQLLEPPALQVGCLTPACQHARPALDADRSLFPDAPARAGFDAHSDTYLKAFHYLTGGGQANSYNYQLLASPELNSWTADNLVARPGAAVKSELAQVVGVDAVVLSPEQAARAGDYQQLGWRTLASKPLVVAPPSPTGLAEQRSGASTVLVVGAAPDTAAHPYNDVFEHATEGMIPYASAWLVKGPSPYIDDYSDQQLASQAAVMLVGYRYHDARTAWDRLHRYVRGGGTLYAETGWQYVDPDWNLASAYSVLPVSRLRWGPVDPNAPVLVSGSRAGDWGPMRYEGGGWGASSADSVRPGAEELVSVGGRVVAARWQLGSGRVFWSGMNLLAHQERSGSRLEASFLAEQWKWLLPAPAPGVSIEPRWHGDVATLGLQASAGPSEVLFKESNAPAWKATLVWPGGSRSLTAEDAEADFLLVRLERVPAGAQLVFTYGPGPPVWAGWGVSAVALALLLVWLVTPAPFAALGLRARSPVARRLSAWRERWREE
jgi:hypothetical protein